VISDLIGFRFVRSFHGGRMVIGTGEALEFEESPTGGAGGGSQSAGRRWATGGGCRALQRIGVTSPAATCAVASDHGAG
jgi:hypothetical protein